MSYNENRISDQIDGGLQKQKEMYGRMTLEEKAKKYCKENGVLDSALFSTKHGTEYTYEILAKFARQEIKAKLEEAAERGFEEGANACYAALNFETGVVDEEVYDLRKEKALQRITNTPLD